MTKSALVVITGPTACGKTNISIALAKAINGEIISADSMQVYKYMDIGTAKPTAEEMDGIKHYCVDTLLPNEPYSVAVFQRMAKDAIRQIEGRNKIPILVGGTGFYINALLYDNHFSEPEHHGPALQRQRLEKLAAKKGGEFMHELLQQVDKTSADNIHPNNIKRVVRALEYFYETGETFSAHNQREKLRPNFYNTSCFILNRPRPALYQHINQRVDIMLAKGLVAEVEALLQRGYHTGLISMQGLGYKEIAAYLKGQYTLEEAVFTLKRDTRRFAKRQITWFKNKLPGTWINVDEHPNNGIIIDKLVNHVLK